MNTQPSASAQEQILQRKVLRALDNRRLKLTLLPTEQCNFRCTYCYEDFTLGRMPQPVVNGLKALLTVRSPELRSLELHWFGGEPLMAFDVISEVCRHVEMLRTQFPQMDMASSLTSNGYLLTPDRFAELVKMGVRRYQISLDGFKEKHDRTRHRIDGSGTFERIWQNLLATRSLDKEFSVMLRVHFTPSTVDQVRELVSELNKHFGDDPRYEIFFKAVSRLGGPNDEQIERSPPALQERVKYELTELVRRGPAGVADPVGNSYVCYAAEPNALVVRSNGQIARCTVAFNDPRNQIGFLHPDGTISMDLERSRLWFDGLENLDPKVLHCPLATLRPYEALIQLH